MSEISKKLKIKMLKDLITIRRFEEKTIKMYQSGEFGGYLPGEVSFALSDLIDGLEQLLARVVF